MCKSIQGGLNVEFITTKEEGGVLYAVYCGAGGTMYFKKIKN
jgi:hypothetical protein